MFSFIPWYHKSHESHPCILGYRKLERGHPIIHLQRRGLWNQGRGYTISGFFLILHLTDSDVSDHALCHKNQEISLLAKDHMTLRLLTVRNACSCCALTFDSHSCRGYLFFWGYNHSSCSQTVLRFSAPRMKGQPSDKKPSSILENTVIKHCFAPSEGKSYLSQTFIWLQCSSSGPFIRRSWAQLQRLFRGWGFQGLIPICSKLYSSSCYYDRWNDSTTWFGLSCDSRTSLGPHDLLTLRIPWLPWLSWQGMRKSSKNMRRHRTCDGIL